MMGFNYYLNGFKLDYDLDEETIKKRLDVYHNQTAPLIDWYANEGIHHHVEGLGTVDEIFARVCDIIDNI